MQTEKSWPLNIYFLLVHTISKMLFCMRNIPRGLIKSSDMESMKCLILKLSDTATLRVEKLLQ